MIELILLGLASWRVAVLLVKEDGPWDALWWLRNALGVYPQPGTLPGKTDPLRAFLRGLLSCIWCCSLWASFLLWVLTEYVSPYPVLILAAAAVAVTLNEVVGWLDQARSRSSHSTPGPSSSG